MMSFSFLFAIIVINTMFPYCIPFLIPHTTCVYGINNGHNKFNKFVVDNPHRRVDIDAQRRGFLGFMKSFRVIYTCMNDYMDDNYSNIPINTSFEEETTSSLETSYETSYETYSTQNTQNTQNTQTLPYPLPSILNINITTLNKRTTNVPSNLLPLLTIATTNLTSYPPPLQPTIASTIVPYLSATNGYALLMRLFNSTLSSAHLHVSNLDKMKVEQLKDTLRERGMKVTGRKAQLVERLKDGGGGGMDPKEVSEAGQEEANNGTRPKPRSLENILSPPPLPFSRQHTPPSFADVAISLVDRPRGSRGRFWR